MTNHNRQRRARKAQRRMDQRARSTMQSPRRRGCDVPSVAALEQCRGDLNATALAIVATVQAPARAEHIASVLLERADHRKEEFGTNADLILSALLRVLVLDGWTLSELNAIVEAHGLPLTAEPDASTVSGLADVLRVCAVLEPLTPSVERIRRLLEVDEHGF